MTGILTLDLSRHTGWAFGRAAGGTPLGGTWELPGIADGVGRPLAALCDKLADAITVHSPDLIVFEAPLPPSAMKSVAWARFALAMVGVVELVAYRREVRVLEERVETARMKLLGKARWPGGRDTAKAEVLAWCNRQGWRVTDDNAGDALVLWKWATEFSPTSK